MTKPKSSAFDTHMMTIALRMAARGLGVTRPNPSVGAVIANEQTGEVVARAVTAFGGRPHAETQAIAAAAGAAKGATIYVTLEPCAHHGQTPPCADAIIAAGIQRVVIAIEDPDPRVAGRGLDRLRAAGLSVSRGVCADEARWLTRGHIVRITERRPFVTLKMAVDAAGEIAFGENGAPRWVTGEAARARGALLRARNDAILIGAATARSDDPRLTCRLPGMFDRSPVRVVLSRDLDVPLNGQLAQTAHQLPLWVMTTPSAPAAQRTALSGLGATLIDVASVQGQIWLPSVMEALVARGITRLLVEGGPTVWRAFANASLVDEVALFMAGHGQPSDAAAALQRKIGPLDMHLVDRTLHDGDTLWRFRRNATREGR